MKSNAAVNSLKALIKKLGPAPEPPEVPDEPVAVLVESFLMWRSTTEAAGIAYQRLVEQIVDFNDLRITLPHEVVELIDAGGDDLALERANRMRAALRDIYLREHEVSLKGLREQGKREIKKYVETIDGVMPYASARTLLLSFETHAIPADEQLVAMLAEEGVVEADADVGEAASWLSRQIKAEKGLQTHLLLQAWVDSQAGGKGRRRQGRRKTTRKKSSTSRSKTKGTRKTAGKS